MTLLVTSDTAQPPPVDQMGRKCKRATSGREGEKRPLTNIKPPCDLPCSLLHCDSAHIPTSSETIDLRITVQRCHIHSVPFFFFKSHKSKRDYD